MKKGISIILMVLFAGLLSLTAQDKKLDRQQHRKESRKEMKAYMEQEVKPVIDAQRAKLDAYLSAQEQQKVLALRVATKELREESFAFRKEIRSTYKGPNSLTEEQEKESRRLKKEKRLLDTRAWAIVDAHEQEIADLLKEIEPNMSTWREEMREMIRANRPQRPNSSQREEWIKSRPQKEDMQKSRGHRQGRGFGPGRGRSGFDLRSLHNPVKFLLWDTAASSPFEETDASMQIYPNPTVSSNTLKFTVKEAGNVKINILDDRGKVLKTILNEAREAGTYEEKFDLTELEKGLYIYQIQSADGISTKKLIIEK